MGEERMNALEDVSLACHGGFPYNRTPSDPGGRTCQLLLGADGLQAQLQLSSQALFGMLTVAIAAMWGVQANLVQPAFPV